jgi:hypothetical protein
MIRLPYLVRPLNFATVNQVENVGIDSCPFVSQRHQILW